VRLKPVYYMRRYGLHEDEFTVEAGSPAAAGGQFAEAETDPVDAMTDTLEAAAAAPLAAMIDAVRRLVASAGSLEDIRDELAALYPEASAADLAEAIGRALTVAHMAGRSDILDGR
jgi:phage gp29-like protein